MKLSSRVLTVGALIALPHIALFQGALAQDIPSEPVAATTPNKPDAAEPLWAFETSDIPVDPSYVFGVLGNGMRYIVRENSTPEGTALVRLVVGSGSLDETDSERGLAHYVEHMAFNGSTNIPEGEMVKLLEREGLAFGADTNASTGFEATTYKLNLPRNDEALLDTALMLMRETASELMIAPEAVERERGVILAERRDRRNFAYKETEDRLAFGTPEARFIHRLPIGTLDVLRSTTAADLRRFYERTYVPENAVVIIIGDFPADVMEAKIRERFADWQSAPDPDDPVTGPVDLGRKDAIDIYTDPALSERVTITRYGAWRDLPDTVANRRDSVMRSVGYAIINRRLAALARGENAPFRSAGFGTGNVFEDARATNIIVDTADGEWRTGFLKAVTEVRRALEYGFTDAEIAEQIARIRNSLENSARGSSTRTHGALLSGALGLVSSDRVPSTPESSLERFEVFADQITPQTALAAVKADAAPLLNPLIRFRGRTAPDGGEEGLRSAWTEAHAAPIAAPENTGLKQFAYSDFGAPGEVLSDTVDERFGFRLVRFTNGVRLNLKQTDIRKDRISYRLTLDGGDLLNTSDDPLKTALFSALWLGGLGEHSQDELYSILAGRNVQLNSNSSGDHFRLSGGTNPQDLQLQLQLITAAIIDPGYRREGEERYARGIENFFASLDATPASALSNAIGGILSDSDPRFTLQPKDAYLARSYDQLRADIGDRLANGAIELALVGDFDPETTIAMVAQTLGTLPARESEFQSRDDARTRSFTIDRGQRIVTHTGERDQALVRMIWPTTDDSDLREVLRLSLLNRVVRIKLQEQLREDLGKSYSPSSSSSTSRIYRGYGTFTLAASIDVAEVQATRAAILTMLSGLRDDPVDRDVVDRARQPLLEGYDNLLKSLGGWMTLADRAQSESDRLERFLLAPDLLKAITPSDIQAAARRYLVSDAAVEVLVLPEGSDMATAD